MNPLLLLGIIQGAGSLIGGISAKNTADLNAFNTETDDIYQKAEAKQMARARMDEWRQATSANIASISKNRDIGSSVSVEQFLKNQKEIAASDVGQIQNTSYARSLQSVAAAAGQRREGRDALIGSLFDVGTAFASTKYKMNKTRYD